MGVISLLVIPIIGGALVVAYIAGRASASTRRFLAVLMGSVVGYGVGKTVNAVLLSMMSWHSVASGARLYDVDITSGMIIGGGGVGLLVSLFVRTNYAARRSAGHTAVEEVVDTQAGNLSQ
jgi:hypothetical protein